MHGRKKVDRGGFFAAKLQKPASALGRGICQRKQAAGRSLGGLALAARALARFWKEGKLQLGGKFCWPVHEVTGAVSKSIFVQRIEIVGIKGIL